MIRLILAACVTSSGFVAYAGSLEFSELNCTDARSSNVLKIKLSEPLTLSARNNSGLDKEFKTEMSLSYPDEASNSIKTIQLRTVGSSGKITNTIHMTQMTSQYNYQLSLNDNALLGSEERSIISLTPIFKKSLFLGIGKESLEGYRGDPQNQINIVVDGQDSWFTLSELTCKIVK